MEISPGEQCLESFKSTLKDPDSGKVVSFKENELIYSATNSYGARTQGKALCNKFGGDKWSRDATAEYIKILNLATNKLEKSNACRRAGGSAIDCAGDSFALKQSAILGQSNDEMLKEESTKELGF